ncbi:hypothetical protein JCM11251_006051 [Rhodosporidiobolus azoricus]
MKTEAGPAAAGVELPIDVAEQIRHALLAPATSTLASSSTSVFGSSKDLIARLSTLISSSPSSLDLDTLLTIVEEIRIQLVRSLQQSEEVTRALLLLDDTVAPLLSDTADGNRWAAAVEASGAVAGLGGESWRTVARQSVVTYDGLRKRFDSIMKEYTNWTSPLVVPFGQARRSSAIGTMKVWLRLAQTVARLGNGDKPFSLVLAKEKVEARWQSVINELDEDGVWGATKLAKAVRSLKDKDVGDMSLVAPLASFASTGQEGEAVHQSESKPAGTNPSNSTTPGDPSTSTASATADPSRSTISSSSNAASLLCQPELLIALPPRSARPAAGVMKVGGTLTARSRYSGGKRKVDTVDVAGEHGPQKKRVRLTKKSMHLTEGVGTTMARKVGDDGKAIGGGSGHFTEEGKDVGEEEGQEASASQSGSLSKRPGKEGFKEVEWEGEVLDAATIGKNEGSAKDEKGETGMEVDGAGEAEGEGKQNDPIDEEEEESAESASQRRLRKGKGVAPPDASPLNSAFYHDPPSENLSRSSSRSAFPSSHRSRAPGGAQPGPAGHHFNLPYGVAPLDLRFTNSELSVEHLITKPHNRLSDRHRQEYGLKSRADALADMATLSPSQCAKLVCRAQEQGIRWVELAVLGVAGYMGEQLVQAVASAINCAEEEDEDEDEGRR